MPPDTFIEKDEKGSSVPPSGNSSSNSSTRSEATLPLTDNDLPSSFSAPPPEADVTVVVFESDDPQNPHNWSTRTKIAIFFTAFLSTTTTSFSSTLTSNFSPALPIIFHVPDPTGPQRALPASLYLAGFVFGPLVWAPLSESPLVGRWRVLATGAALFVLACLGQAVVGDTQWGAFLVLRFLGGVFGSPPISVFGGVIADLYEGSVVRGRVMMYWSAIASIGPLGAPILSGFVSTKLGWRAVFWIAMAPAVGSLVAVFLMPETLASAILKKKAAKLNKEHANTEKRFVAPSDIQRESAWASYKTTLSRPWRLLFGEMVVSLSCAYLGFVYAVFYMLVQIFPRIFQGVYGFAPGMSGIFFLTTMGLGTIIGTLILLWYERLAPRLSARHPTKQPEYLRLPVVCAMGPVYVVSMLWLGWTARSTVHWLAPLASLIPYGVAYNIIYTAIINYVADAYGIYSASALAAMSMTRSMAGTLLPLAIEDMVANLGIAWSCTVLAGVSAGLALVPFGFIAYGEKIRAGSRFSAALKPGEGQGGGDLARVTSLPAV